MITRKFGAWICVIGLTILFSSTANSEDPPGPPIFEELTSVQNSTFYGRASYNIPIEVPPGRGGIAPNLALRYGSSQRNGWLGVGWDLNMGYIQRSSNRGVNYNDNNFVAIENGTAKELVPIGDWGPNYYELKIEGKFSKYYYNSSSKGWEVTTKDGTKYYYGSSAASRQDYDYGINVFKWCLDKVQDTNGNYMNIMYYKDGSNKETHDIYLDKIEYTGNANLGPDKSVLFHRVALATFFRPITYAPNRRAQTLYSLGTIEVRDRGSVVRAYRLSYEGSYGSSKIRLAMVRQFGNDAQLDPYGIITNEQTASKLPPVVLGYPDEPDGFQEEVWTTTSPNWGGSGYTWAGDFNGDGRTDIATASGGTIWVKRSEGSSFVEEIWSTTASHWGASGYTWIGDFNGDGKSDIATASGGTIWVKRSEGSSFVEEIWSTTASHWGATVDTWIGDFDGDGKSDIATKVSGTIYVKRSTGDSFVEEVWMTDCPSWPSGYAWVGDFNGDRRSDIVGYNNGWLISLKSTGSSFEAWWGTGGAGGDWGALGYTRVGDFNGDGRTDIATVVFDTNGVYRIYVYQLKYFEILAGEIDSWDVFETQGDTSNWGASGGMWVGDFNGDGKSDIGTIEGGIIRVKKSIGANSFSHPHEPFFWEEVWTTTAPNWGTNAYTWIGDFNGDGKREFATAVGGTIYVKISNVLPMDLLNSITNPFGGTTAIEYAPSTSFTNTLLPYSIPVVTSITTNDNNGTVSQTTYTYSNGLHDIGDREFRGFGHVTQTNSDQTTVERWFHQDNVFKGFIKDELVKDSAGNPYMYRHNTIEVIYPSSKSAFPFVRQKDQYLYDGMPSSKQLATWFEYDIYGNSTRRFNYGDTIISGDESDENIEYTYDTAKWIVSKPSRIYVIDSIGIMKSQSWFDYYPANGNLRTKTDWLENGENPVTFLEYNTYGNLWKITDPKGFVTRIDYDNTSYTYPEKVTKESSGLATSTSYDFGFGTPLTETDFNTNTTTYQYDTFGRLEKVIGPYDSTSPEGTQSIHYENFGLGTGHQRVAIHSTEQSGTLNFLWNEDYFDGFGRTIGTRREGPDGKVIVDNTLYDTMGRVAYSSLPYFDNVETPRWVSYSYDPIGRVTGVINPDNTSVTRSYQLGTTVLIDANGHKKEEDRDAYGNLVKVREYTGASPNFALYASTQYHYDVLGNLDNVVDTAGNVTSIGYDTLSRKTWMNDPDMGYWSYHYDANGNLDSQTDAKNQTITLGGYDALNRVGWKHYPTGPDVVYTYDEAFSLNPKGRLTTVSDASGTTKFFYDKLGRTSKTIQAVDGVDYTTESAYDALGRTTSVTYPDPGRETVPYTYNTGGNVHEVVGYATFFDYNALGQPGTVTNPNGDNTIYQYYPWNNRLFSITTNGSIQGLQNISYAYDNVGNITSVTSDYDPGWAEPIPVGEVIYDYTGPKPHAVKQAGPDAYTYDANGNMENGAGRTMTYNVENRIGTLVYQGQTNTFIYDSGGARVKKITPGGTTNYLGGLYECKNGICTKHIFDGQSRIASKTGTKTYFYHTDHLGSTNVVTDERGTKVQETAYDPFGETRYSWGSVNLAYKFTGQEEDQETGLYNFGVRYYEPRLGRFVKGDSRVKSLSDPQSLNRYSYAGNNPLRFFDPTGEESESYDYELWFLNDGGWTYSWDYSWDYSSGYAGGYAGGYDAGSGGSTGGGAGGGEGSSWQGFLSGFNDGNYSTFFSDLLWDTASYAVPLQSISDSANAWNRSDYSGYLLSGAKSIFETGLLLSGGMLGPVEKIGLKAGERMLAGKGAAGRIVIGENMDRVRAAAKRLGAEYYKGPNNLEVNRSWIQAKRALGYDSYDIGPDFTRRMQRLAQGKRPDGDFYNMERMETAGYQGYQRLFQRTGRYQGGVPGLDW